MIYLGKILGSETKIKLLFVLINNPATSYMEKELAKESKSSVSEVNRQISDLVNIGIIAMQRIGKAKTYSINRKHFLFLPLQTLFIDLNKIYKRIALAIKDAATKKFRHIQTIILIGSLAHGKVREDIIEKPSDIDLIFIVKRDEDVKKVKNFLLGYINKKIFSKYGITPYPFVISQKEYLKRLNKKDPFILNTYTKGEIIYGKKPRRFS